MNFVNVLTGDTSLVESILEPIPVFIITDANGAPLVASGEGRVTGVFISQEDADLFIVQLSTNNPELAGQVEVTPVSLAEIYRLSRSPENIASGLNFAYVPEEEAVDDAIDIGNANQQAYQGGVPLFVARGGLNDGFLTIEREGQEVIPFFFDLEQLEETIAKFKEQNPELAETINIEVIPLEGTIETLATSNDPTLEQVILIPTEESINFLETVENVDGNFVNIDNNDDKPDVYRFFNRETGVHFYTASQVERDSVLANLPNYTSEGVAYQVADPLTGMENTNVVHRFLNQNTGIHIYTIDEVERDFIANNLTNYQYEGEVFAAYELEQEGTIPIHRFYNSQIDAHFYTASEIERETVENELPNYDYEGIAYYAYPVDI